MARTMDFNQVQSSFWDITLRDKDRTVVHLDMPTEALVNKLQNMGAEILINGKTAIVTGQERLRGANVTARDLRAGAALIIAGLAAEGTTKLKNIHFVERGYENIIEKFTALGADIQRVED